MSRPSSPEFASCAYVGTVVHKRLAPKRHAFTYRVFALCLDVDEIGRLHRELRLFSRNRRNLVGFYDRDFGAGTGERIGTRVRRMLTSAGLGGFGARIRLLCYPRLLGFVFNPLSVYFCYADDSRLGAIVYEVSNTLAERKCYVIPVTRRSGECSDPEVVAQSCDKELYVSPFIGAQARYGFHVRPPGDRITVGVTIADANGPVLKTYFCGTRRPLSDGALLSLVARYPLMTLKVVAGIHLEAARLFQKGVPVVARHKTAGYSVTVVTPAERAADHAQ